MRTDPLGSYIDQVLDLYVRLPHTPIRSTTTDRRQALAFNSRTITWHTVETALLLGSLRRLCRSADAPSLAPIRSLAYFLPVVEEVLQNTPPPHYTSYLRQRIQPFLKNTPSKHPLGSRPKNSAFT